MRIADGVYVLPIPRGSREAEGFLNLTLLLDEDNGNTLVDAGLPGQAEAIDAALGEAGIGIRDLRRIIFTHQDLDHVGSGGALVRQSGARVIAHPADAPYIDGSLRPLKVTPEMLERRPQMREVLDRLEPVRVDEHLEDGERLDLAGGIRVIFTPGHTPGHLSLYLERPKVLVAGDALTAEEGRLNGPNPPLTLDAGEAARSVRRLAELDVETIVCYHGGVVDEDADGQLHRVVRETSGEHDDGER
jgi:glyoxylase-like metal-dependent hydrolase (beta-lactamase superfamily II)